MTTQTENQTRKYVPRVGANVKLRTWSDYTTRNISMWAWFKVLAIVHDSMHQVLLRVLNGSQETEQEVTVPLAAIDPPIGWASTYDIYVTPDKVEQVLSWFARGIKVKVDHALDRLAGNAYMPADVDTAPTWGYYECDTVSPADCPNVFRVIAYVEQEFHMPKDPYARRMYRKAARANGWTLRYANYGAHGGQWYRSKEVTVYSPDYGIKIFRDGLEKQFSAPRTAVDILWDLEHNAFPMDTETEQQAIKQGQAIPRWILARAGYYLNGYTMEYSGANSSTRGGNSTWMYDPSPDAKDPVDRH